MASTAHRALRLLSLLGSRGVWPLRELAERLGVSGRTVRRDLEVLRGLGYAVTSVRGPDGGYRLGAGGGVPLVFDREQALAVAVALQTAPGSVFGLREDAERALETVRSAVPEVLRAAMESVRVTRLRNHWEFPAPPIDPGALTAVGVAVRRRRVLVVEVLRVDGSRACPGDGDFVAARAFEPQHLVVWAGRWYLVGCEPGGSGWRVLRVDRVLVRPTTAGFVAREVPGGDLAGFVMGSHDRGDSPARWQCSGSARVALPAGVVARWAPGGSVVEHLDEGRCRLVLGAWSWAGVAGILATFDAEVDQVRPVELVRACRVVARRYGALAEEGGGDAEG